MTFLHPLRTSSETSSSLPFLVGLEFLISSHSSLCRLGYLAIPDLTSLSHLQASKDIYGPITKLILDRQHKVSDDAITEQKQIKRRVKLEKRKQEVEKASNLRLPDHLSKAAELAQDKGSSSWLSTLPLEEYSFSLTKSEFRDALSLRYVWLHV